MCRWFIYFGNKINLESILYDHKNSILKQSFKKKFTPFLEENNKRDHEVNVDGFGIGWYINKKQYPTFYKCTKTPWSDFNFKRLSKILHSNLIFAHIRAIKPFSEGLIHEFNCHPFCYKKILFMHNGDFKNFNKYKKKIIEKIDNKLLLLIKGTTDSEYIFYLILTIAKEIFTYENIKKSILETINIINEISKNTISLNIAITNGDYIIFTRYINNDENPCSLYFKDFKTYILISSEPIDYDDDWSCIPRNSIGSFIENGLLIEKI